MTERVCSVPGLDQAQMREFYLSKLEASISR